MPYGTRSYLGMKDSLKSRLRRLLPQVEERLGIEFQAVVNEFLPGCTTVEYTKGLMTGTLLYWDHVLGVSGRFLAYTTDQPTCRCAEWPDTFWSNLERSTLTQPSFELWTKYPEVLQRLDVCISMKSPANYQGRKLHLFSLTGSYEENQLELDLRLMGMSPRSFDWLAAATGP